MTLSRRAAGAVMGDLRGLFKGKTSAPLPLQVSRNAREGGDHGLRRWRSTLRMACLSQLRRFAQVELALSPPAGMRAQAGAW